jgi:hypothetical protein
MKLLTMQLPLFSYNAQININIILQPTHLSQTDFVPRYSVPNSARFLCLSHACCTSCQISRLHIIDLITDTPPVWWPRIKNGATVTDACRKRRLKWVPSAWTTMSPGVINTEAWSSRLGVGRWTNNPAL